MIEGIDLPEPVHRELAQRIESRDGAGARDLMDGHVRMMRNRRVSESASRSGKTLAKKTACC